MALQIGNAGASPGDVAKSIHDAIAAAIPGADIEIGSGGSGHFDITVVSSAFEGKSRVQQHQIVYGAITELMSGNQAPVHAIDRLDCRVP